MTIDSVIAELAELINFDRGAPARTATTYGIAVLVALLSYWLAGVVRRRVRRGASSFNGYADLASILSRAFAFVVYLVGAAIILALLGVSPNAIATILAAATIGSSLAMQDVAKGIVNGLYVLFERPYRIGDLVRIGEIEGRVEEIGVRMTQLRSIAGDRVSVPNSLVFTSVIENASTDRFDRITYQVTGIEAPPADIPQAIASALVGVRYRSQRVPAVSVISSSPTGAAASLTVEVEHAQQIDQDVFTKLGTLYPTATVSRSARTPTP